MLTVWRIAVSILLPFLVVYETEDIKTKIYLRKWKL